MAWHIGFTRCQRIKSKYILFAYCLIVLVDDLRSMGTEERLQDEEDAALVPDIGPKDVTGDDVNINTIYNPGGVVPVDEVGETLAARRNNLDMVSVPAEPMRFRMEDPGRGV